MWVLSILVTITVLVTLGLGLRFVENLESENRAVEAQLRSAQMYDDAFGARMKEMQRFRHDVNGLLQTIEYESKARAADGGVNPSGDERAPSQESGSLVNALIELKRAQCEDARIAFTSDVTAGWRALAQERGIEEADIQAVAQNLLQNAYEASLEVLPESDRLIGFCMGNRDGKLCIEVTNRIASDEMPTFKTAKQNPEQHGIGLRIVEDIAAFYDGSKSVGFDPQARLLTLCVLL